MITSLLDTDLYKLTMMQCIWHQLPNPIPVEYAFYCRKPVDLTYLKPLLEDPINAFCALNFTTPELDYLKTLPFFKPDFIEFLSKFKLNRDDIKLDIHNNQLQVTIQGNWVDTILYEVPILAMISERYYQTQFPNYPLTTARQHLGDKISLIKNQTKPNEFYFSDFGTRRRFSKFWHHEVLETLTSEVPEYLSGTSNLYLAHQLELNPIGTMAHEYLQAFQAISPDIHFAQRDALHTWLKEYPNQLGIALTDALGIDQFLKEFDGPLANAYLGVRHDSGDPFEWTDKLLAHYAKHHIDPHNKSLVYSDSLTIPKAIEINQYVNKRAHATFGIGTNLMNDVGLTPLDIVIKLTHANDLAVVKYPDSQGKIICTDPNRLQYLKSTLNLKEP